MGVGPITQPHLDLPMRYENGKIAVVQQDTVDDIRNCVEAALRTELGSRAWVPDFGVEDPTFDETPLNLQKLTEQISTSEPRAKLSLKEQISSTDNLVDKLVIGVQNA